jgi:hypothetical protein
LLDLVAAHYLGYVEDAIKLSQYRLVSM